MIRPDDEEKPFVARWNVFTRILLVNPSVKLIARTAGDYADFTDGTNCFPSNLRLARDTGYDERTVRMAWSVMRGLGMAERVEHGVAHKGIADKYELMVPDNWKNMAVTGPRGGKFTCLQCSEAINPQPNVSVSTGDKVLWKVHQFCFCPKPRATKGREGRWCFDAWNAQRPAAEKWGRLGQEAWEWFRKSRGDDW